MLLPFSARKVGWPLALAGGLVLFLRHGLLIAPEWLNIDVFAVSSLFVQRRTLGLINNNVMDEIGVVMLIAGTICIVMARERTEDVSTDYARLRALLVAVWAQAAAFLLVMLFTFGLDFFAALLLSLAVFPVAFGVAFRRNRAASARGRPPLTQP